MAGEAVNDVGMTGRISGSAMELQEQSAPLATFVNTDGIVEIPLTRGYVALVDAEDAPALLRFNWHVCMSGTRLGGARRCRGKFPRSRMHREIMRAASSDFVDHINGDTLDNRRCNLRLCSEAENNRNRKQKKSITGYKGIGVLRSGNFQVSIMHDGKVHRLGTFSVAEDAARAYDAAAIRLHGQFARLNFPDENTRAIEALTTTAARPARNESPAAPAAGSEAGREAGDGALVGERGLDVSYSQSTSSPGPAPLAPATPFGRGRT